jgi:hypothetical protein
MGLNERGSDLVAELVESLVPYPPTEGHRGNPPRLRNGDLVVPRMHEELRQLGTLPAVAVQDQLERSSSQAYYSYKISSTRN